MSPCRADSDATAACRSGARSIDAAASCRPIGQPSVASCRRTQSSSVSRSKRFWRTATDSSSSNRRSSALTRGKIAVGRELPRGHCQRRARPDDDVQVGRGVVEGGRPAIRAPSPPATARRRRASAPSAWRGSRSPTAGRSANRARDPAAPHIAARRCRTPCARWQPASRRAAPWRSGPDRPARRARPRRPGPPVRATGAAIAPAASSCRTLAEQPRKWPSGHVCPPTCGKDGLAPAPPGVRAAAWSSGLTAGRPCAGDERLCVTADSKQGNRLPEIAGSPVTSGHGLIPRPHPGWVGRRQHARGNLPANPVAAPSRRG